MLKDQTKFYNDYKCYEGKCAICLDDSHLINACPITNYVPNREFIIKKLNHSAVQQRISNNKLKERKKINARKNMRSIQTNARKIADNKIEEDASERSLSDECEVKSSRNIAREKTMVLLEYPPVVNKFREKLNSEEEIFVVETQDPVIIFFIYE